jgi:uncharacterized membrane protein YeaQ/YmgE (transglycosylase-associated protein family)
MDILLWIAFGLVVGVVAKFALPGPDPGGIVVSSRRAALGPRVAAASGPAF